MSVPRSVAEVLKEHVSLEVEGIDRMYLNVYVPQLQREEGVASFFRFHRGHRFVSSVLMDPISKTLISNLEKYAKQEQVPIRTHTTATTVRFTSTPSMRCEICCIRADCMAAALRRSRARKKRANTSSKLEFSRCSGYGLNN